ncbi:MAG: hypothetical protein H7X80_08085, partial [bacterium]|nr:hypothetical protein [Candidatus Kapabacteria bacterium]
MNTTRFLLLLGFLTIGTHVCNAQSSQGPSSLGTEFVFSFPSNYEDPSAPMQYIRLYMTSNVRTRVRIYTGTVLKKTLYTDPGAIVQLDLTKAEAQALVRENTAPIPNDQVYRKKAITVIADAPIALHGMNRTSYTSDGMLILPTSALGSEYVVASARDGMAGGQYQGLLTPSQFLITAPFNNTTVTIKSPWQSQGHAANEQYTVQLNKGDVFSSMSIDPGGDLTGATISATKPVAVTAGNTCANLPDSRYRACDHLEEMLTPISTWGTFYHSVPYATRLKGDMYRVFAAEPDTDLFINGIKRFTLSGRGGAEGQGWIEYLPPDRNLLEFAANKPIMVAQYNTSQTYDNVVSDPFYSMLVPYEQFRSSYTFATPPAGDFASNYITIVADSIGYSQIEIAKDGANTWQNLSQMILRAARSFTTQLDGRTIVGVTYSIDPGGYAMRGPAPFGGYVYGFGSFDSYGYPLGTNLIALASADSIAPVISSSQASDGTVDATVTDKPDDPNIRSNLASISVVDAENYMLEVDPFEVGVDASTTYRLVPIDPALNASATVEVYDKAGNSSRDVVSYTAKPSPLQISSVNFGLWNIRDGETVRDVVITNSSTTRVTVTDIFLQSDSNAFEIVNPPPYPRTIEAGASDTIRVAFDPQNVGEHSATLTVIADGVRVLSNLIGRGIDGSVRATDLNFGVVQLSQPLRDSVIFIENTGNVSIRLRGIESVTGDTTMFSILSVDAWTNETITPG